MENDSYEGIPDDLAEKIRKDHGGAEKALQHWHDMMGMDCPDLDREGTLDFLRDLLKENPWRGFDDLSRIFMIRVRELDYLKKLEPVRDILVEIERMIGSSCCNAHIQNYSSWGILDSQGRASAIR